MKVIWMLMLLLSLQVASAANVFVDHYLFDWDRADNFVVGNPKVFTNGFGDTTTYIPIDCYAVSQKFATLGLYMYNSKKTRPDDDAWKVFSAFENGGAKEMLANYSCTNITGFERTMDAGTSYICRGMKGYQQMVLFSIYDLGGGGDVLCNGVAILRSNEDVNRTLETLSIIYGGNQFQ